ncbi:MFS transporter [Geminicoccus roseus]|uniref:MFS transporter n=1 Tax=Geminicoccus roseus TaxID=404900 RepID=UPI00041851EC|nr:MFS transporter [Geminicoccus roseus]
MTATTADRRGAVDRNRAAVSTVFMVNGTAIGLWAVHIPIIGAVHGIDEFVLGLVLLTVAGGAMATMPLAGWAAGRFGSDRATRFFIAGFVLVMALPVLAPNLPLLFVAALLFGMLNGGLDVAMNAQATDVERARGRATMSSFHGFWSLGGLTGAAIGGVMIGAGWGDGSGLLLAACLAAAIIAFVWNWLLPLPDPAHQAGGPHFALPHGAALVLGLLAMMVMVVEGAAADWSALHLVQNTGATPAVAAAGFAAFSLAMASCRFIGDAVTDRFGRVMVLRAGGFLITAGFLITTLVPMPFVAAAGFGLIGLGAANIVPVLLGQAARLPGTAPGAGVAAVATIGYVGFLAGPPLIGFLAKAIGLAGALGVLTLAGIILMLAAGMVRRR